MSYHIVYGVDSGEPIEGPHLASGSGWLAWVEWVLGLDGYEEVHVLAENGWCDNLTDLATELEWLAEDCDDDDLLAITKTLREVAARPPQGAKSVTVTDGTPAGEEGEDDGGEEEGDADDD